MGIIITKFRKKKTTEELLEKLEKDIKCIEEYRKDTEQSQRKIVGGFLLISIIVYLGTALLFYFYFFPATIYERIWYIIPLLLAPVMIVILKKGLTFFYSRRITKNQDKLKRLNDEKKKILEKVMETETYKVAKNILEKYAPEQIRKNPTVPFTDLTPAPIKSNALRTLSPSATGLRHRAIAGGPQTPNPVSMTTVYQTPTRPGNMVPSLVSRTSFGGSLSQAMVPSTASFPVTPLPLPRAILPRERSVFDKVVEYLVGDGPSNRYALICKQCSSHNGMALKEEFEYLSFACCYCFTFNPARKKRPIAPKLETETTPTSPPAITGTDTSESERNSATESDNEEEEEEAAAVALPAAEEPRPADEEVRTESAETEADESGWKTDTESVVAES